jgi:hypothetical protein
LQRWQVVHDRVPDDIKVDVEVAVRDAVAHVTDYPPRDLLVLVAELVTQPA